MDSIYYLMKTIVHVMKGLKVAIYKFGCICLKIYFILTIFEKPNYNLYGGVSGRAHNYRSDILFMSPFWYELENNASNWSIIQVNMIQQYIY